MINILTCNKISCKNHCYFLLLSRTLVKTVHLSELRKEPCQGWQNRSAPSSSELNLEALQGSLSIPLLPYSSFWLYCLLCLASTQIYLWFSLWWPAFFLTLTFSGCYSSISIYRSFHHQALKCESQGLDHRFYHGDGDFFLISVEICYSWGNRDHHRPRIGIADLNPWSYYFYWKGCRR